jgi:hypothetical protein
MWRSSAGAARRAGLPTKSEETARTLLGEVYSLHVAWFGPGLVAVGLSDVARGIDPLLGQGALAYAGLACGPGWGLTRTAALIARLGLAGDRPSWSGRQAQWRRLPAAASRCQAELEAAYRRITERVERPSTCVPVDFHASNLLAAYGLTQGLPDPCARLTSLCPGQVIAGDVVAAIGPFLFLHGAARPAVLRLLDTRLLAGWTLHPL